MSMHSWTAPAETDESELREWCALNCHNGWRIEPQHRDSAIARSIAMPRLRGLSADQTRAILSVITGPTLFVNDEHELVHAKLRFS